MIDPPALLLVVCAADCPEVLPLLTRPRTVLFGGSTGYLGSIFEPVRGGRIRVRYRTDGLARFSPELAPWLPILNESIVRHTTRFALEPGQGYVLHNHRWLHGRTAFTGERVMYRLSINPHPEFAIPSGFEIPGTAAAA